MRVFEGSPQRFYRVHAKRFGGHAQRVLGNAKREHSEEGCSKEIYPGTGEIDNFESAR